MYTFVKLTDNRLGMHYPWMMKCSNLEHLLEHSEKYMSANIKEGFKDIFRGNNVHRNTDWGGIVEDLARIQGIDIITASCNLENKILQGKIKKLNDNGFLYLRESGTYMIGGSSYEETQVINSPKMIYPNYTISDIKISKWDGGRHYYAKIGCMDVQDDNGNVKWNTEEEAMKHSLNELENIK